MDIKYFNTRLAELEQPYNQIKPLWQELANYYLPRAARFLVKDVNKAPKFSPKIKDEAPMVATRNFASGMMSGATSPTRKWFKISVSDYKADSYEVKKWTAAIAELFREIFNKSNLYQNLPLVYKQLGIFGLSCMSLEKDYDSVIRTKVLPIGSYKLAKNHKGEVDTVYRCYMETANNLKEKFGEENLSESAKRACENNQGQTLFEIVHVVEKNKNYKVDSPYSKEKEYISVYYEKASNEKFLSKSGFDYFPYIVFEADVNGEDIYPSDSPGITALPAIKQLKEMIVEYGKAVKLMVDPPKKGPASLKNRKLSFIPGSFIPVEDNGTMQLEAIYQLHPSMLSPLESEIEKVKNTIGQVFYNDLFAMMVNTDRRQITATEIDERREEKMVLLSPLLEQIHTALKQLINIVFQICLDADLIPPALEEIQGGEIKVEFVSTLAQAQKAASVGATERFVTFVANLAGTVDPSATMKLNINEIINDYAEYANIEPDQIVPNDVVEQQKQAAAEQQAAQNVMNQVQQGSEIVKNIGGADSVGSNLMERLGIV